MQSCRRTNFTLRLNLYEWWSIFGIEEVIPQKSLWYKPRFQLHSNRQKEISNLRLSAEGWNSKSAIIFSHSFRFPRVLVKCFCFSGECHHPVCRTLAVLTWTHSHLAAAACCSTRSNLAETLRTLALAYLEDYRGERSAILCLLFPISTTIIFLSTASFYPLRSFYYTLYTHTLSRREWTKKNWRILWGIECKRYRKEKGVNDSWQERMKDINCVA